MAYIYKIFRRNTDENRSAGYVGQDSGATPEYKRIWDHFYAGYGLGSASNAGGSKIVKEFSACDLCVHTYEDENNCFGAGISNFNLFKKTWSSTAPLIVQKLTFAETMWICAGMADKDSEYNMMIADKCNFTTNLEGLVTNLIQSIYKQKELDIIDFNNSDIKFDEVTMHFPDRKENVEKMLHPEFYAILRGFEYCLSKLLFAGDDFKDWLVENIIQSAAEPSYIPKLRSYINDTKEKEIRHWNKALQLQQLPYRINSAEVRFDFEQDLKRINTYIINHMKLVSYNAGHQIAALLGLVKFNVKSKSFNIDSSQQMSQTAERTLRLTRNAFIGNMHAQQKIPTWYTNALQEVSVAQPTRKLHMDAKFIHDLKVMSYTAFVKLVQEVSKDCPIQGGIPTLIGRDEDSNQLIRAIDYARTDTLLNRMYHKFFEDKKMTIIKDNWNTYYRQCVSIYMKNLNRPLEEIEQERAQDIGMVEVRNVYDTRYFFKPYTWNWIVTNYGQTVDDLVYY